MKNLLYDKASTLKLEETLKKKGISSLLLMTRAGFNIYQLIKNKIKYDQIIVLAGLVAMEVMQFHLLYMLR